ncbi:MAG: hypothetical protein JO316_24480 [Abitibacteriaceae bacterium]|nr:hypothetical protein [Abditibacteriaceae bacterium]
MTPDQIQSLLGSTKLYTQSIQHVDSDIYCFAKDGHQHYLIIIFDPHLLSPTRDTFSGETQNIEPDVAIKWCMPTRSNAAKLRQLFPWTAPQPLGLKTSFGAGDRLGLAAPAHIQAARECGATLILAQQSIREMTRTQRTPDQVLDAATWGAFQENYQEPWGADADHLKTEGDVRQLVEAGFTFFTIDPSEFVDDKVLSYNSEELETRFAAFKGSAEFATRYLDRTFEVPLSDDNSSPLQVSFSRVTLLQAALKYGRAVAHTDQLAQLLDNLKGTGNYDLEMSVDETATPTSVEEHFFIAHELKLRGVQVQSLALRFVGEFQKGIDYIGNLGEFEARLRDHITIARHLGPYKISIHSGSDKFSIFPIIGKVCGGLVHEKTAGTWYLEALRVIARVEPKLFRKICEFAAERFPIDRATYHVVSDLHDLPDYERMANGELESILDNNTGRQMLHVTFGSVLTDKNERGGWRFRDRIYWLLENHEDLHYEIIKSHSKHHMQALGMCHT